MNEIPLISGRKRSWSRWRSSLMKFWKLTTKSNKFWSDETADRTMGRPIMKSALRLTMGPVKRTDETCERQERGLYMEVGGSWWKFGPECLLVLVCNLLRTSKNLLALRKKGVYLEIHKTTERMTFFVLFSRRSRSVCKHCTTSTEFSTFYSF